MYVYVYVCFTRVCPRVSLSLSTCLHIVSPVDLTFLYFSFVVVIFCFLFFYCYITYPFSSVSPVMSMLDLICLSSTPIILSNFIFNVLLFQFVLLDFYFLKYIQKGCILEIFNPCKSNCLISTLFTLWLILLEIYISTVFFSDFSPLHLCMRDE